MNLNPRPIDYQRVREITIRELDRTHCACPPPVPGEIHGAVVVALMQMRALRRRLQPLPGLTTRPDGGQSE